MNGFSQLGEGDTWVYYDVPEYEPFWAEVERLDVPFTCTARAAAQPAARL